MSADNGKKAAEALSDFLNKSTSIDRAQFIETLTTEHRFLQQEAFNLMLNTMQEWSNKGQTGNFDPRNEHAVTTSYNIMKFLGY